nr:sugar ABC transporter ATP-binding protein [Aureibacillus halotolerans]
MTLTSLHLKDICISFPGINVLKDVSLQAHQGKVHALLGANGAGKSTLMKILAGAYSHYKGSIELDDNKIAVRSPRDAKRNGIQVVHQEVDTLLVDTLTVGENIMMEQIVHQKNERSFVHWTSLHKNAQDKLDELNVRVSSKQLVSQLTLAEKQMVVIARAVTMDCRFLVLDEPTAPLSDTETQGLFRLVRSLTKRDVGIIFISHRLPEIYELCDEVTIMRDGRIVAHDQIEHMQQSKMIEHMIGTKLAQQYPEKTKAQETVVLEVTHLSEPGKLNDVNLHLKKGEIVGLAGLVGAGKTEVLRALFGASPNATVELSLHGKHIHLHSPASAVAHGIALVPEERRRQGIFIKDSVRHNLSASSLGKFTKFGLWLHTVSEKKAVSNMISSLGIKAANDTTDLQHLSGGNQQKVAIGKWLLADADVYLFDEPTKGVDIGAKRDIFLLLSKLAKEGKTVLYASSELSEIIGISHRIYVMYDGQITKEFETEGTTEEELMFYCTGGTSS